jgi:hypothetical protein
VQRRQAYVGSSRNEDDEDDYGIMVYFQDIEAAGRGVGIGIRRTRSAGQGIYQMVVVLRMLAVRRRGRSAANHEVPQRRSTYPKYCTLCLPDTNWVWVFRIVERRFRDGRPCSQGV